MAKRKPVGGSVVREYLTSEAGQAALAAAEAAANPPLAPGTLTTVGKRGRFSAGQVKVFQAQNKGQVYVAKTAPTRKVTGTRVTESGRKQTVTVVASVPEIRAWAESQGMTVGGRGRVSQEVLSAFAARPKA